MSPVMPNSGRTAGVPCAEHGYETTRLADLTAFELIVTVNRALAQIQSSDAIVGDIPRSLRSRCRAYAGTDRPVGLGNLPE